MAVFRRSTTLKGTIKNVVVHEGKFVDNETSEQIDLAQILADVYGNEPFDIATSLKTDEEL